MDTCDFESCRSSMILEDATGRGSLIDGITHSYPMRDLRKMNLRTVPTIRKVVEIKVAKLFKFIKSFEKNIVNNEKKLALDLHI